MNKDCKAIEEKAVLNFKKYILNSQLLSQFVNENDKGPCWDGDLFLYSDSIKDKAHFIGKIPVQVKGTEVQEFICKKYKFKVETADLKAYLHEPTIYVVCQEKKNSEEYKIFYRALTSETIKSILRGKENQQSIKILMYEIPAISEFEKIMTVFYWDSQKQLSFADKPSFTFQEVMEQGIHQFSFTVPSRNMNKVSLLGYLSSYPLFLYAKINKPIEFDIPISDGPVSFIFQQNLKKDIKVGNKVFYSSIITNIKDGKMQLNLDKTISITFPLEANNAKIDFKCDFVSLESSIKATEFTLAIYEAKSFSIEDVVFHINTDGFADIDKLKKRLDKWKSLKKLLNKLHIKKDLDLSQITAEQEKQIDGLLETILNCSPIKTEMHKNSLIKVVIGNINLLLWLTTNEDGMCMIGDFFDHQVKLMFKKDEKNIEVSPFTYLQNDNLWEWCDNIPYDKQLTFYKDLIGKHDHVYEIANYDLLAMLKAYDNIENKDKIKENSLMESMSQLNGWLLKNDMSEHFYIHEINHYQIIKRKRELNEGEVSLLLKYLDNDQISALLKVGICLLLENNKKFDFWLRHCTKNEQSLLKTFPIWKYRKLLSKE